MVEECRNTGEDLPEPLQNMPVLYDGMALYFEAWFDLDRERNRVKLEPIKRSQIWEYARDYELDAIQTEDLEFYIREMDRGFMDWFVPHLEALRKSYGRTS